MFATNLLFISSSSSCLSLFHLVISLLIYNFVFFRASICFPFRRYVQLRQTMADFLTDKKQRRRDSIYRPYVGDYLKLNEAGANGAERCAKQQHNQPSSLKAKI
jgi:hypothetical protein